MPKDVVTTGMFSDAKVSDELDLQLLTLDFLYFFWLRHLFFKSKSVFEITFVHPISGSAATFNTMAYEKKWNVGDPRNGQLDRDRVGVCSK